MRYADDELTHKLFAQKKSESSILHEPTCLVVFVGPEGAQVQSEFIRISPPRVSSASSGHYDLTGWDSLLEFNFPLYEYCLNKHQSGDFNNQKHVPEYIEIWWCRVNPIDTLRQMLPIDNTHALTDQLLQLQKENRCRSSDIEFLPLDEMILGRVKIDISWLWNPTLGSGVADQTFYLDPSGSGLQREFYFNSGSSSAHYMELNAKITCKPSAFAGLKSSVAHKVCFPGLILTISAGNHLILYYHHLRIEYLCLFSGSKAAQEVHALVLDSAR
jgi:hypothetical protein